jgi:hypothetical protein
VGEIVRIDEDPFHVGKTDIRIPEVFDQILETRLGELSRRVSNEDVADTSQTFFMDICG